MMLALLLQLSAPAGLPAAPVAGASGGDDTITVLGRRMKEFRFAYTTVEGRPACRIRRSTGAPEMDAMGCEAMLGCLTPHLARIEAIDKAKASRKIRQRRLDAIMNAEVLPCFEQAVDAGLVQLAAKGAA